MYRKIIFDFDYRGSFHFDEWRTGEWHYTFEREQMIATVNILCGNLTVECADAARNLGGPVGK